jgi:hypothetical protein
MGLNQTTKDWWLDVDGSCRWMDDRREGLEVVEGRFNWIVE